MVRTADFALYSVKDLFRSFLPDLAFKTVNFALQWGGGVTQLYISDGLE